MNKPGRAPSTVEAIADFAIALRDEATAELRASIRNLDENYARIAGNLRTERDRLRSELATANRERAEVEKVLEAERAECRRRNDLIIEARAERDAARSSFEAMKKEADAAAAVIELGKSGWYHSDVYKHWREARNARTVLAPPSAPKAEGLHWAERTNEERTRIIDDILARVAKLESRTALKESEGA